VVAPTARKAASDPQLFPYPLKEEWWAMGMAESQIPTVHQVHDNLNQGLQQQHHQLKSLFHYVSRKKNSELEC